jgi:dipeptidyl aminopeptidase/acylaminoacyl peptidase
MVLDRATGRSRSLTPAFDYWVEDIRWAPDSRALYFATHVKGKGALYRVELAGGTPEEIWSSGTAQQFELSPDGRQLYVAGSSLLRPTEIYVMPSRARRSRGGAGQSGNRVTRVNDKLMSEFSMGVSSRTVKSADGKDLQAWVVNPPDFEPGKKYPAILLIHGGPQSAWTDSWSYRWNPQVFAGYGYVVYAANPRGSTGFGQEFIDAISNDWGGKVYDDLMRQTDDLVSLPHVDKDRVGAAGASYGGYMIAWIAGHTDRFKALVCHDGIIDTLGMGLETEELWFTTWDMGGLPWASDGYEKWNPVRHAKNFKTPTLVVTNEKDYRVPFGQGLQFFTALQVQNVPSRLLTFPDEGHWVLKPGNSRVWHAHVMDWFHRYLGGADPDPEALEDVYSVTR